MVCQVSPQSIVDHTWAQRGFVSTAFGGKRDVIVFGWRCRGIVLSLVLTPTDK